MRLIYALLAIRMLRLARFDLARSERLNRDGDEAFARSRKRVQLADALVARARLRSGSLVALPVGASTPAPSTRGLSRSERGDQRHPSPPHTAYA